MKTAKQINVPQTGKIQNPYPVYLRGVVPRELNPCHDAYRKGCDSVAQEIFKELDYFLFSRDNYDPNVWMFFKTQYQEIKARYAKEVENERTAN